MPAFTEIKALHPFVEIENESLLKHTKWKFTMQMWYFIMICKA